MFTESQKKQIVSRGSDIHTVEKQIEYFKKGFPFLEITEAATFNHGLLIPEPVELNALIQEYEDKLPYIQIQKFVPASGAASRMFKHLFEFMSDFKGTVADIEKFEAKKDFNSVNYFFANIYSFGFASDLEKILNVKLSELIEKKQYVRILEALLTEKGLNYGNLPKALLKFHSYADGVRTPIEEHMVEGAKYCKDKDGIVQLHFTVSPEHKEIFISKLNQIQAYYESLLQVKYEITLSIQKPGTDTIAVDMKNEPFLEKDNALVFRPAGHGALIENLNDLNADIIFVKNIDNIVPDRLKEETFRYKKAIAGILVRYQRKIFDYIQVLESNGNKTDKLINEISDFVQNTLCVIPPHGFETLTDIEKVNYLKLKLNRPIRVCGMVKNEGEPGGGPFWAKNTDGTISLQIVESSQIDLKDIEKQTIVKHATHFNPVDLVCGAKNYKNEKFDLTQFTDPQTGFISVKSKDGKDLQAQELPGLWNGAMSNWNTIFVEVPIITFNPVKTVNDLLRPEHQ